MNFEDYSAVRDFIEEKSLKLMSLAGKDFAKTGFPPQNYTFVAYPTKAHFFPKTNPFKMIIANVLFEARDKHPELFGTGDAKDVIQAIFEIDSVGFSFERFTKFLQVEQFCYVVEKEGDIINDKILRIDLFRDIKPNAEGKNDFVGGIFHALKHFTHSGKALSTESHNNDIPSLEYLLVFIAKAFFTEGMKHKKGQNYESVIELPGNYKLKVGFYYEAEANVYFINTAYRCD